MHSCFDGWELDRGWRRGGFSAAVVSCHEICRDARACFFLFFYVGAHVLCIRCPGKHGCLRAWPSSCHSESRPPVLFLLFLPFFSPLNPHFSFRTVIFALKHPYVMRRRVIRRVIRTVGPFLIFRTRVPPLALYHVARIIRTIVRRDLSRLRNYFEVTRCYIYHPLHVHFFYDLFYLKKNRT